MVHIKRYIIALFAWASWGAWRDICSPWQGMLKTSAYYDWCTHLKAHRTAASLPKKGIFLALKDALRVAWTQSCILTAIKMESQYACYCQKVRWVTIKARLFCCQFCMMRKNSLLTKLFTLAGLDKRYLTATSSPVFLPKGRTTTICFGTSVNKYAIKLRTCLQNSKISRVSQQDRPQII